MNDIGKLLRDGDPVAREPHMPAVDVQAVRRAVFAALDKRERATGRWPGPLLAASAVTAALAVGVTLGLQTSPRKATNAASAQTVGDTHVQRQLQFASPGGTRIIWVFDPEFNP